jgi:hypothetical protein
MKPARTGNAFVDGVAVTDSGQGIAIEVKSPRDDIIRGIGQCCEALAAGYNRAALVTTLRMAKKLKKRVFQRRRFKLLGVDAKARIHRYDADGWRLLGKKRKKGKEPEVVESTKSINQRKRDKSTRWTLG